jgi:hypothetical protein
VSPDIDELVRASMRRHAADAPTRVDLVAVRARSQQITRRRRYEATTAVITTLALLLGLGYAASRLRTEATPIQPSPTSGSWTAFFRFDQNAAEKRFSRLMLHTASGEKEIASAETGAEVVGWYGEGHRTLVYTEGNDGSASQSPVMSVTLGDDGSVTKAAGPLDVSAVAGLTGIPYPLENGFAVWRQTGSSVHQGELVTVNDSLTDAVVTSLPEGRAILVTPTTIAMAMPERATVTLFSPADGSSTEVAGCSPMATSAVAPDGIHASVACGDGSVVLLNLSSRTSYRTSAIPGAATASPESSGPSGAILSLWYDPALALHASMTPGLYANYSDVRDYGWDGASWNAEGTGVLTRVFPTSASPLRFERLPKDGVDAYNAGRWIVEGTNADLGASTGTIAVRAVEKATPTPTPSPSSTTQPLPPAPAKTPWTASVRDTPDSAPPSEAIEVTIDGRTRQITPGDNAATEIAGWTGADRRTLVWGATQDYQGDQMIFTATFAVDGSLAAGPTRLTAPDGSALAGRPVVLADGRLVVWRMGTSAARHVQGTLLRYSDDLSTATTQQLPEGDLVFATPDYVGLQEAQWAPSELRIVPADGSTAATITPALGSCATGYHASVDATGVFAALSCTSDQVDIVPISQAGNVGTQPMSQLPDGAKVLATWFTPDDETRASTRSADGTVSTWRYEPDLTVATGRWVLTTTQGVAFASYVDGYAVQLVAVPNTDFLVSGRWTTGTGPSLDLGTGTGFASLVARPSS